MAISFVLPGYEKIELKPNGKNILLTLDNIKEYLDLIALLLLYTTISPQILAFRSGFNIVIY